jgi:hypothetical protein
LSYDLQVHPARKRKKRKKKRRKRRRRTRKRMKKNTRIIVKGQEPVMEKITVARNQTLRTATVIQRRQTKVL